MSKCPPAKTLASLGNGSMSNEMLKTIQAHVETCANCKAVLKRLARDTEEAVVSTAGPYYEIGPVPELPGFEIKGELGWGSMGVVYLARWIDSDRLVAVKILREGRKSSIRDRERWLRETRLIGRVPRHNNVVQLLLSGESNGCFYLVLELASGGNLKDRLTAPLPPRVAAELLEAIARAVDHIHGAGLLHLDLKPSNILLDGPPDASWDKVIPRITDFSIARLSEDPLATFSTVVSPRGTPAYMAPEQIRLDGEAIGPAADIHALGSTFYQMLCGHPPFLAASITETYNQVLTQEPVSPRRLVAGLPRDLETICLKCLEKDPSRRYPSAAALADDLRRWLDGLGVQARPISTVQHIWRHARRRPTVASLLLALNVTIILSLVGLFWLWRRSETQRGNSELARAVAEEHYQTANHALNELLAVTLNSFDARIAGQFREVLETARRQQLALRKERQSDPEGVRRLATINRLLALAYIDDARLAEARSLLFESIGLWESVLTPAPFHSKNVGELFMAVGSLGNTLPIRDQPALSHAILARWNALVESSLKLIPDDHEKSYFLYHVSLQRLGIADGYALHGELEEAQMLRDINWAWLHSLPASNLPGTVGDLCFIQNEGYYGSRPGLLDRLRIASGENDSTLELRLRIDATLAQLAARMHGWLPSFGNPTLDVKRKESPEQWADQVVHTLEAQCSSMGRDPNSVPRLAYLMASHFATTTAAAKRRRSQLDDAYAIVEQELALADRIIASYPVEAKGYLLRSEGYVQKAKNGFAANDGTWTTNYALAYEAARQAVSLDPDSETARFTLQNRRERLEGIARSK
jgi:serine/threonine protein kinase